MGTAYDGYIRVSDTRGRSGESFISPEVQRHRIETWAHLRGVEITMWHTDLDVTGGVLSRPGLDAMMDRVRSGETRGVAVAHIDRLSRASVADALRLVEEIHDHGAQVAVVDLGVDPTTPTGEMMLTLLLALARMQRRQIADNWATARQRAVARGLHVASRCPTGYQRRPDGRLEPHASHAPAIREVFEQRAAGASWVQLARLLDERGVVGPYEAAQWTPRALEHIIRNRAYLGEGRSGDFINPRAHEALVDPDLWEAAQRPTANPAARSSTPALLAGLLRCAGCRHLMKPDRQTMRDGTRARTYRCRGRHASGTCESRAMILGSVIEPHVEALFMSRMEGLRAEALVSTDDLDAARRSLADAEAELSAYRDSPRLLSVLGEDRFVEGLEVRVQAVEEARSALREVQARQQSASLPHAELESMWADLDVRERQQLLHAGIDAVMVRSVRRVNVPVANRALILWHGESPNDLPGRGRRGIPLGAFAWPDDPGDAGVAVAEDADERPLDIGAS